MKRRIALLTVLALVLGMFAGLTTAFADNNYTNTGVRHEVCEQLSEQAEAYYVGDYSWDELSALPGTRTDSSAEAAGSALFKKLHQLMRDTLTTTITYSALTSYWRYTDAAQGTSNAVLFYSDQVSSSYNREHVWPKSQGNFYQDGAGSDLHHLRPTNSGVNSARSHYTMGNVRGVLESYDTYDYGGKTVLYYDGSYSKDEHNGIVEVNDEIKGDVARVLLYVYAAYGDESGANLNLFTKMPTSGSGNNANQGNKVIESLDTLLDWCETDPVDTWEMGRNDACQNVQGNRNVFIDYPELAWMLFDRELPDMPTPSGYAHDSQQGSFTVTAVSDDEAHGTVTGSGKHFIAQPAEGWYAAGWTLEPSDAAEVTQNGNSFRLSGITADCTLTIHFAAKGAAAVHYAVPDGVSCEDSTGYLSESVVLPTPEGTPSDPACEYSFVGWVDAPVEAATEKPTYLSPGKDFVLTETETTLYALYTYTVTDGQGTSGEYARIAQMADGDYVIGAPAKQVMMNNDYSAGSYMGFSAASFTGDVITNAKDENVFTFTAVGDSYAVYDCNGYALRADGKKKVTLDPEKTAVGAEDTAYLWSVTVKEESTVMTPLDSSQGSLQYNGSSPRFTTYTSAQVQIALYGTVSGTRYYSTLDAKGPTDPCAEGHSWDEGVVLWMDCVLGGEIRYTCTVCGTTRTEGLITTGEHDWGRFSGPEAPEADEYWADAEIIAEPSCTEPGMQVLTCTVCGKQASRELAALGHDWGEPTYEWREDFAEVTATRVCKRDESHVETETVQTDREITKPATVDEAGEITYTATFENEAFATQTKTDTIPKLDPPDDPQPINPFEDVEEGKFFYDAVLWAVNHEPQITNGTDATHFAPGAECTRGQVVTFLWRAKGCPEPASLLEGRGVRWTPNERSEAEGNTSLSEGGAEQSEAEGGNPFADVTEGKFYYKAVLWAVENNITAGMDATHFGPGEPCTRGQVVTFLWRAAGKPEPVILSEAKNPGANRENSSVAVLHQNDTRDNETPIIPFNPDGDAECPFEDVVEGAYYYDAMLWAVANEVTNGTSATTFSPGATCTRGQVVTFLYRALAE